MTSRDAALAWSSKRRVATTTTSISFTPRMEVAMGVFIDVPMEVDVAKSPAHLRDQRARVRVRIRA